MTYSYDRRAATAKHQAVVDGLVTYLKSGPFKSYLRVKSVGANKVVLIPQNLNDQVTRVEISGLLGDKAEFVLFLENGDSGWAWDEWRQPPKFHNDAGYNVLHLDKLDRIANPQTDPEKFEQHMLSFLKGTLVPAIQRTGWVIDPVTKKPTKLDQWLLKQPAQKPAPAPVVPKQPAPAPVVPKPQEPEPESGQAWSVVTLGRSHGYATEVQVFNSKSKAEAEARDLGNCYVVKGTQMWNEPLGQVEEHDRDAPYKFFR